MSIIIPAFNEAQRILPFLKSIDSFLPSIPVDTEVIIVNDGSTDLTQEVVFSFIFNKKKFRLLHLKKNLGKGAAVRYGFNSAKGNLLLFVDADGSISIQEVIQFLTLIDQYDFVIASRSHSHTRAKIYRKIIGNVFQFLIWIFLNLPVRDTQCGFKLIKKNVYCALKPYLSIDHFAFDLEWIALAHQFGFTIKEMSVVWVHVPQSKVHILRDSWKMFLSIFYIRSKLKNIPILYLYFIILLIC